MLSFSLVAEALTGLIYHRRSGENSKFLPTQAYLITSQNSTYCFPFTPKNWNLILHNTSCQILEYTKTVFENQLLIFHQRHSASGALGPKHGNQTMSAHGPGYLVHVLLMVFF